MQIVYRNQRSPDGYHIPHHLMAMVPKLPYRPAGHDVSWIIPPSVKAAVSPIAWVDAVYDPSFDDLQIASVTDDLPLVNTTNGAELNTSSRVSGNSSISINIFDGPVSIDIGDGSQGVAISGVASSQTNDSGNGTQGTFSRQNPFAQNKSGDEDSAGKSATFLTMSIILGAVIGVWASVYVIAVMMKRKQGSSSQSTTDHVVKGEEGDAKTERDQSSMIEI